MREAEFEQQQKDAGIIRDTRFAHRSPLNRERALKQTGPSKVISLFLSLFTYAPYIHIFIIFCLFFITYQTNNPNP